MRNKATKNTNPIANNSEEHKKVKIEAIITRRDVGHQREERRWHRVSQKENKVLFGAKLNIQVVNYCYIKYSQLFNAQREDIV